MLSSPDWKLTLVNNRQVSLQSPTTKYPCSAQLQSIPVPNHQVSLQCLTDVPNRKKILPVPNHQVSLQCPTTRYPCSAQPQSILAMPNRRVSLQCSTTKYPCRAQPKSIPAVRNSKVSILMQRICSAAVTLLVQ